jgi:hypothetical protein
MHSRNKAKFSMIYNIYFTIYLILRGYIPFNTNTSSRPQLDLQFADRRYNTEELDPSDPADCDVPPLF